MPFCCVFSWLRAGWEWHWICGAVGPEGGWGLPGTTGFLTWLCGSLPFSSPRCVGLWGAFPGASLQTRCLVPVPGSLGCGGCLSFQGLVGVAGAVSLGWTPCGIGRHALLELCGSPWVGVAAVPLGLRIAFCLLASAVLVDLYRVFRLSCMVLSQNTGVLSLLVFAIGCGVSGLLSSCHLINTFCYMFELWRLGCFWWG